jgi:hypothetical protein
LLKLKAQAISALLGIDADGLSVADFYAVDVLADLLLAAPKIPLGLARQAHDAVIRERVQSIARHGEARSKHWERVGAGWEDQLVQ